MIPWPEIDRLLVFGEMVRDAETGREDLRYPSQRELGRRFGVSGALIGRYAKQHRCMERRKENRHRAQVSFEQKLVDQLAETRATSTAEMIEIADDFLRAFREALREGRVRTDSASDFNLMVRLRALLEGQADSRPEVQGFITLEQIQQRHRALRAQYETLDPVITGEVQVHDRNCAPGLPAEQPAGAKASSRAVASRRRADDDIEPAPRRRVMVHEREDAPRDAVSTMRRRARADMDTDDAADFAEARAPRQALSSRPAPTTVRRPDRERGIELPDAVYTRRLDRRWDEQPEHGHRSSRGANPLRRSPNR